MNLTQRFPADSTGNGGEPVIERVLSEPQVQLGLLDRRLRPVNLGVGRVIGLDGIVEFLLADGVGPGQRRAAVHIQLGLVFVRLDLGQGGLEGRGIDLEQDLPVG
jgi:hypothetical protein